MIKVLLYYKYINIKDPEAFRDFQQELCNRLNMKGRILIASEGLNGTASGEEENLKIYMQETENYPGIGEIDWKISDGDENTFPKLRVVVRDEVVTLGLKKKGDDVVIDNKAAYIEPEELAELYKKGEEFFIIDARNEYEARIGRFKDAIYFDIQNFRELPEAVKQIEDLKNKPVITYCTGGIRCEKASAMLKEFGFENVRQLHGGIAKYSEKAGGENFEGTMYVFDGRIHVPVNNVNPSVISECVHCKQKVARYINCANVKCNKQFICCEGCEKTQNKTCSQNCLEVLQLKHSIND